MKVIPQTLLQKRIVRTKLDIYDFIRTIGSSENTRFILNSRQQSVGVRS